MINNEMKRKIKVRPEVLKKMATTLVNDNIQRVKNNQRKNKPQRKNNKRNVLRDLDVYGDIVRKYLNPSLGGIMKLPGDVYAGVPLPKKVNFTVTTPNIAGGAVAFAFDPTLMFGASVDLGTFFYSIGSAATMYQGINNPVANSTVVLSPIQSFTNGTYTSYRLSFCRLTVTVQSTLIDMGGEMHLGLIPLSGFAPGIPSTATVAAAAVPSSSNNIITSTSIGNPSNISNYGFGRYKRGNLASTPTGYINWVPSDRSDYLPTLANATEHPTTDAADNIMCGTVICNKANQNVEFCIEYAVEVLPTLNTMLTGMEKVSSDVRDPFKAIQIIHTSYSDKLIGFSSSMENVTLVSNNKIAGNPRRGFAYASKWQEQGIEWHVPGYNYLGPGTHIEQRLSSGVQPIDPLDSIAMAHDMDYQGDHDQADDLFLQRNSKIFIPSYTNALSDVGIRINKKLRTIGLDFGNWSSKGTCERV